MHDSLEVLVILLIDSRRWRFFSDVAAISALHKIRTWGRTNRKNSNTDNECAVIPDVLPFFFCSLARVALPR